MTSIVTDEIIRALAEFMNDDLIHEYTTLIDSVGYHDDDYTENHHVLPVCKGGMNTSYITLKGSDHYRAHHILSRSGDTQMYAALSMMMNGRQNHSWFTPEMYEECRKSAAIACGMRFRGKTLAIDHKRKISDNHPAKTNNTSWLEQCGKHMLGKKRPEFGKKISKIQTGRSHTEERRRNLSTAQSKRFECPKARKVCSDGAIRRFEDPDQRRLASIAAKARNNNRIWITDGYTTKLVTEFSENLMSRGFVRGRRIKK